jgi:hypothetical protein
MNASRYCELMLVLVVVLWLFTGCATGDNHDAYWRRVYFQGNGSGAIGFDRHHASGVSAPLRQSRDK